MLLRFEEGEAKVYDSLADSQLCTFFYMSRSPASTLLINSHSVHK